MTKLLLILALVPMTTFAANEVRVGGAAAREVYDSLTIKAVNVIEEHTDMPTGIAKYGKTFGCERNLDNDSTYCWFGNQEHSFRGSIQGDTAVEVYRALGLQEEAVIDEHANVQIANAKYGKNFGCQFDNGGSAQCWFK